MDYNINLANTDKLGFLGVFMYFAFGEAISILAYFGLMVDTLTSYNIIALLKYAVYAVILIKYLKKVDVKFVTGLLLYVVVLLSSCLVNEKNIQYIYEISSNFIINILPLIILILYVNNSDKFLRYMRFAAYVVAIWTWTMPFSKLYLGSVSYMSLAYGTMVSWAVITFFAFKEQKWLDIIFSLITAIVYVVFASRGAILCVAGYLLYCVFFFTQSKQRVLLLTAISISTGLLILYFQTVLLWLSATLNKVGISSRTITLILKTEFVNTSGRDLIYHWMLQGIADNPFGYGIGYDRVIGGGYYAHNLFLELFIAFGVVLGGLISLGIIYVYGRMLFNCEDKSLLALFSVFAIPGFIMLQLSGSVFINYHVFIALVIAFILPKRATASEVYSHNAQLVP